MKITVLFNKFDLHRGAMYLFVGYIGSGKTTLMDFFAKQKIAPEGMIFYEDLDLSKISKSKYDKDINYLSEINNRPWFAGKVKDFIFNKIKNQSKNKDYQTIFNKICNSMKISDFILNKGINSLSEGEYRWIQLAINIALDSKVLIIDYLDKSLDSNRRVILNRVLKRKI